MVNGAYLRGNGSPVEKRGRGERDEEKQEEEDDDNDKKERTTCTDIVRVGGMLNAAEN